MQQRINLGVFVAAIAGGVFGLVTTLEGAVARSVGAINASLLEHMFAGFIAIPAVIILFLRGKMTWNITRPILPIAALLGIFVLVAVAGIAYAMPRVGVTAGNMALLFGQIAVAVLIDTIGLLGYERVPLSLPRIVGLILMVIGIYLVLLKQS
jgi:bacterial/archaeal transporter family-2 protein